MRMPKTNNFVRNSNRHVALCFAKSFHNGFTVDDIRKMNPERYKHRYRLIETLVALERDGYLEQTELGWKITSSGNQVLYAKARTSKTMPDKIEEDD